MTIDQLVSMSSACEAAGTSEIKLRGTNSLSAALLLAPPVCLRPGHHPNSQRLLFELASCNDPVAPHNTAQCAGDMRQEAAGEDGTWLVTG